MCHESSVHSNEESDLLQDIYKPIRGLSENEGTINSRGENRRRILAQTFVTGAVMLSSASCGMPVGYSAILLPQLKIDNDSMRIDDELGSWIASLHSLATPLGSLLSGIFMDRFGRKVAMQIASTPLILGWMLIGLAPNHTLLLIGRVVAGISAGLAAAAGQVLIGEVSEPHLRGVFSSGPLASYSFGILLVYALGFLLPWRQVAGISAILPITSLIMYFFLPESPVWLTRKRRLDEARNALVWLRGGNFSKANQELDHMIVRQQRDAKQLKEKTSLVPLLQPEVLKPLLIVNLFNFAQILSGTYLIVFYAVDILKHVQGGQDIDHLLIALLTASVRFIFSIMASILLAFIGRRSLAMISGLGTSISALFLGLFLYQNCQGMDYIPAFLILVYVATNTIGFFTLPGVLLSELFPTHVRGLAGGLTFMLFNFLLFGVAKTFPLVKSLVGVTGVFWIFGTVSLLASMFLFLTLPETRSMSLSEIEDYFKKGGLLWRRRRKRDNDSCESFTA